MDSNLPTTDLEIAEKEQTLPIVLLDLNSNSSILVNRPIPLRDFIRKFKK